MSSLALEFEYPLWVEKGIADGSLVRHANRIHSAATNRIVYHLTEKGAKEVVERVPKNLMLDAVGKAKALGALAAQNTDKVVKLTKNNPRVAGAVGVGAAVVIGGAGYAVNVTRKKKREREAAAKARRARVVSDLEAAFKEWSAAVKAGNVTLNHVEKFETAWANYEQSNKAVGIAEDDDLFAKAIYETVLMYTEALKADAETRGKKLAIEAPRKSDSTDALLTLQRQLLGRSSQFQY